MWVKITPELGRCGHQLQREETLDGWALAANDAPVAVAIAARWSALRRIRPNRGAPVIPPGCLYGGTPYVELEPLPELALTVGHAARRMAREVEWTEAAKQIAPLLAGPGDWQHHRVREAYSVRRAGRRLHRNGNRELAEHLGVVIDDDHESVTIPEPETVLWLLYDEPIPGVGSFAGS